MNKADKYYIQNIQKIMTEWTVDGVIGDEKYFELLKLGNGKDLPDIVNVNTTKN